MPKKRIPQRKIPTAPKHDNAAALLAKVDRPVLLDVLESSGEDKMIALAYKLMDTKQYGHLTLAQVCATTGVGFDEVSKLFQKHQISHALMKQAEHAPEILESNAIAAKGKRKLCPTCDGEGRLREDCTLCKGNGKVARARCEFCEGKGQILSDKLCLTCNGEKWIMEAGDSVALKIFAESAGLTQQKQGVFVGVNLSQNFGGGGTFEDLMRDAEKRVERKQIVEVKAE